MRDSLQKKKKKEKKKWEIGIGNNTVFDLDKADLDKGACTGTQLAGRGGRSLLPSFEIIKKMCWFCDMYPNFEKKVPFACI